MADIADLAARLLADTQSYRGDRRLSNRSAFFVIGGVSFLLWSLILTTAIHFLR